MRASTELDADREGTPGQKEPEAVVLEGALKELKVQETFRALHPKARAVKSQDTRRPEGAHRRSKVLRLHMHK